VNAVESLPWPDAALADPAADVVLRGVALGYGGPPVVTGLSGCFAKGSLTAVVGPNGGGKTTLLKGLLGLIPVQAGAIDSPHSRQAMGHLAQASEVDRDFPVTVADFVSIGLWPRIGGLRAVAPALARRVAEAIAAVGLQGCETRWMAELSGGQFQRMRFARLLVQDSPVMLLDEPFAGIDAPTTTALLRLVADWHAQGKTVIAVLHDLDMVRAHFPQTLALAGRPLAWGDTAAALAALAQSGPVGAPA
jgi:zinc/manganese transport system ATP-binding protein